jgi:hypothetical protein
MDIIDLNVRDSEIEDLRAEVASLKQQAILRDLEIVRLREALKMVLAAERASNRPPDTVMQAESKLDTIRHAAKMADEALSTPIDISALARHDEEIVGRAHIAARLLAYSIYKRCYNETAPEWEACDTLEGVLSQIDNMVAGMHTVDVDIVRVASAKADAELWCEEVESDDGMAMLVPLEEWNSLMEAIDATKGEKDQTP